ncbi:hypothetical protein AYO20_02645 [Fonsecaea nubica]|uniref:Xylanolytic transcriptional activator regulatory domain-containing protein n=1 Tax=Fonsecaea nubica TaxID=856822 RepID=A0A178DAD0_9EURO|nr:hypothetical protein AYO20_02645 [Fonsecaea nubica]OAL38193.1 hypothetical protein AYO20_02645 [Fonsecaea nubica]
MSLDGGDLHLSNPASLSGTSLSTAHSLSLADALTVKSTIPLPSFIKPLPAALLQEDIEYLHWKGAFMIPDLPLQNELLRCYIQYVHPYLPVLDLRSLLSAVESDGQAGRVSIVTFQAVMFASTPYVSMDLVRPQGISNRRLLRKTFFQRIKVLVDFECDTDVLSYVQALLLMTYFNEETEPLKNVWHWLGIAIAHARHIDLENNLCDDKRYDMATRKIRKRVWWSLYMRDRLTAVALRRPVRLSTGSRVPLLELSDFDIEAYSPSITQMLGGCQVASDVELQRALAILCIDLTKLCVRISQIPDLKHFNFSHLASPDEDGRDGREWNSRSNILLGEYFEVLECDRELENWFSNLPLDLTYQFQDSEPQSDSSGHDLVYIYHALLTGLYFAALCVLHRPLLNRVRMNFGSAAVELREYSCRRIREASNEITDLYRDLCARNLVEFLPNTGVTCVLPAAIFHLQELQSQEPSSRLTSMRKLETCMQALRRLQNLYASAEFAVSWLARATRGDVTYKHTAVQTSLLQHSRPPRASTGAQQQGIRSDETFPSNSRPFQPLNTAFDTTTTTTTIKFPDTPTHVDRTQMADESIDRAMGDTVGGPQAHNGHHDMAIPDRAPLEAVDTLIGLEGGADFFLSNEEFGPEVDMSWFGSGSTYTLLT